jgi:succinoglycan biosynthesis protein ExoA
MPSSSPLVSVVMPVRNERRCIERSLRAVLEQDYPRDLLEIVVADGMSTDGTRDVLQKFKAHDRRVTLLDNPKRTAPCALNLATAVSKGEVVIRVDGHCEIARDYVSNCVAHLVGDGVDGVGGSLVTVGETEGAKAIAAAMSSPFGVGGAAFRTAGSVTMVADTVPFPAYTRRIIEIAGPYDERFTKNQDDEYNYRIRKVGGRLLLAADVHSRYYSRATLRSLARQYYGYGLYKPWVFWKNPRQMKLRQFIPAGFVACLLALAILSGFWSWARWALLAVAGLYAAASTAASLRTAARTDWHYLPVLPAAFATLHVCYGAGFLVGMVRVLPRAKD